MAHRYEQINFQVLHNTTYNPSKCYSLDSPVAEQVTQGSFLHERDDNHWGQHISVFIVDTEKRDNVWVLKSRMSDHLAVYELNVTV